MNTLDAINSRRSVRRYDASRRVSDSDIAKILEAAMFAPSAHARFPWEFVVVKNPEALNALSEAHAYAKFLPDAGVAIIVCGDLEKQHKNAGGGYWMVDCAAATQNMLLAAYSLGISSCWCGVYPEPERTENFIKILNLPEHIKPFSMVVLGYALNEIKQPPSRYDISKIHQEKW